MISTKHLLKPILKNKLPIINVISQIPRIYRLAKRFADRATQYNPYNRYAEHFPPHYRPYVKDIVRGADIAFSGGLISEVINQIGGNGQKSSKSPSNYKRQKRNYMEQSKSKRQYKTGYCPPFSSSAKRRKPWY